MLFHDFPHLHTIPNNANNGTAASTLSITLNGVAEVLDDCNANKYRQLHLSNNPGYSQFIEGEGIAVILIRIEKASMCDIEDKVSYWNNRDGMIQN